MSVVVGGEAADAQIVEQLAHFFGVIGRPLVVGREEFNHLITHLRDRTNGAHEVFGQLVAHGIEFEADRYALARWRGERQRRGRRQREK